MSFDATCFLSGLPIKHGDKVRFFIVKEANKKDALHNTIIYPDSLYKLVTMPIAGQYYDYGAIEKIEHNANTRHIEQTLQNMEQKKAFHHDKADFVQKYDKYSIDYYTQVISRSRNCVLNTGYSECNGCGVLHTLCHEDAYRAVIRAQKLNLNEERERRHEWNTKAKPYTVKNKHTASWNSLLSEEKEEIDNWNRWIRPLTKDQDLVYRIDSAWGKEFCSYQERAKDKDEFFAKKYPQLVSLPEIKSVFNDTNSYNHFVDRITCEGSYSTYWFNELYCRPFVQKFEQDQLTVDSAEWQSWRQTLAEFIMFIDGMSNLRKFYVPFIYAPNHADIDLNKFFNKAVGKIIVDKKRNRE
jgi:hypothetical protein